MFEKEAEEIANKKLCSERICYNHCNFNSPKHHRCGDWHRIYECAKESAEFGYNKANEWHKVADGDLPKENKLYFVKIKDNGLAIAYFNGRHWETRYNLGDYGHCVETVIAWREIPTFEE